MLFTFLSIAEQLGWTELAIRLDIENADGIIIGTSDFVTNMVDELPTSWELEILEAPERTREQ